MLDQTTELHYKWWVLIKWVIGMVAVGFSWIRWWGWVEDTEETQRSNCKQWCGERGKVIIIDSVINAKEEEQELTETKFLFDILMSVNANGKERTESEWAKLFFDAGFCHYKITPIFGMKFLIEVYP